jgi:hypothetical protein
MRAGGVICPARAERVRRCKCRCRRDRGSTSASRTLRWQVDVVEEVGRGALGGIFRGGGEGFGFLVFVGVFVCVIFISRYPPSGGGASGGARSAGGERVGSWRRCGRCLRDRRWDGLRMSILCCRSPRLLRLRTPGTHVAQDYGTATASLGRPGSRAGDEAVPACEGRGCVRGDYKFRV